MKSSNGLARLNTSLRHTVLSRLLFTYIAIMLVMLAAQSLLMGQIYQQEYFADRVSALNREASDLTLPAAAEFLTGGGFSVAFTKDVYDVAKRQGSTVWIMDLRGDVFSMSPDTSTGSQGDTVPSFKVVRLPAYELQPVFTQVVVHGESVTKQGLFQSQFATEMLTVGVPILYNNFPVGAVFINTKMQAMYTVVGKMYRNIVVSAAIAMLIGIVLISLMSSRISKPLAQMNEIAGHISRGDFTRKADVKSRDEIGELALSFNSMAEELKKQEDLRSGFVANVSHELRSPLTSIHGFAQGMLDGTIPQADHQKYLEVIVGETRRLNKLIRELLDLSQIESGKFPLNMQVFDVNELISRVLITFEEKIVNKCLEIEVDFKQDKAIVLADPDRIEQVVINLVDNAVKFTPEGGRISLWSHGASDRMLIGVADNGPGIPLEDQPYVWERFYKVDKSHSGKKGTGLGLSIVKKIIDQHGERITLTSQPGNGATFVFSLKKQDATDKWSYGNKGDES